MCFGNTIFIHILIHILLKKVKKEYQQYSYLKIDSTFLSFSQTQHYNILLKEFLCKKSFSVLKKIEHT